MQPKSRNQAYFREAKRRQRERDRRRGANQYREITFRLSIKAAEKLRWMGWDGGITQAECLERLVLASAASLEAISGILDSEVQRRIIARSIKRSEARIARLQQRSKGKLSTRELWSLRCEAVQRWLEWLETLPPYMKRAAREETRGRKKDAQRIFLAALDALLSLETQKRSDNDLFG